MLRNRYAVAVVKGTQVVGHVPREYSKLCWNFLRHCGRITCEITGRRKRSFIKGKGLVPCVYKLKGNKKFIIRLCNVIEKKTVVRVVLLV